VDIAPERLTAQLAAGPLRRAYLIAGPEPLRAVEAADAIRAAARAHGFTEREIFETEGNREADWDQMHASFRAPGLFSSGRVVELRLPTGKAGKKGEALLLEYCADPPADVVLLVHAGDWSRGHEGKWSEAIGRIGVIVRVPVLKPHELPEWIDRRLHARGLKADREAVQRLAERVEGNLLAAAQEIEKLALLGGGEVIDAARMESLVTDAARFDVFRLVDLALNGQPAQVARVLAGLRAEGTAVPALMGMVVRELLAAAALARTQERGGNLAAAFKAQRIWDSKQAVYRRALARHPAARWERFVAEAGRVDRISKGRARDGEPGDPWMPLERLLLAVADARGAPLLAG